MRMIVRSSLLSTVAAMALAGGVGIAAAQHEGGAMSTGPAAGAQSPRGAMGHGGEGGQDRHLQAHGHGELQGRGAMSGSTNAGPHSRQGRAGQAGTRDGQEV